MIRTRERRRTTRTGSWIPFAEEIAVATAAAAGVDEVRPGGGAEEAVHIGMEMEVGEELREEVERCRGHVKLSIYKP